MHRVFKLYEISPEPGLLTIEDERGVPGDLYLTAVGLTKLQRQVVLAVNPDTFEFQLADRDVWIDDGSNCLHGVPPFSQILLKFFPISD